MTRRTFHTSKLFSVAVLAALLVLCAYSISATDKVRKKRVNSPRPTSEGENVVPGGAASGNEKVQKQTEWPTVPSPTASDCPAKDQTDYDSIISATHTLMRDLRVLHASQSRDGENGLIKDKEEEAGDEDEDDEEDNDDEEGDGQDRDSAAPPQVSTEVGEENRRHFNAVRACLTLAQGLKKDGWEIYSLLGDLQLVYAAFHPHADASMVLTTAKGLFRKATVLAPRGSDARITVRRKLLALLDRLEDYDSAIKGLKIIADKTPNAEVWNTYMWLCVCVWIFSTSDDVVCWSKLRHLDCFGM